MQPGLHRLCTFLLSLPQTVLCIPAPARKQTFKLLEQLCCNPLFLCKPRDTRSLIHLHSRLQNKRPPSFTTSLWSQQLACGGRLPTTVAPGFEQISELLFVEEGLEVDVRKDLRMLLKLVWLKDHCLTERECFISQMLSIDRPPTSGWIC